MILDYIILFWVVTGLYDIEMPYVSKVHRQNYRIPHLNKTANQIGVSVTMAYV